jgi:hypothetical protein
MTTSEPGRGSCRQFFVVEYQLIALGEDGPVLRRCFPSAEAGERWVAESPVVPLRYQEFAQCLDADGEVLGTFLRDSGDW